MPDDAASLDALERVYREAADRSVFTPHRDALRAVAAHVRAEVQAAAAAEAVALRAAIIRWLDENGGRGDFCPICGAERAEDCDSTCEIGAFRTALATPQSDHAARVAELLDATVELISGPHSPESYDEAIERASAAVVALKGGGDDGDH
ncbi:MAG: hypothetical protein KGK07_07325 [Chloroflexota bacterium]|nr:hypothetical protein [Chloroflexota bacterium]